MSEEKKEEIGAEESAEHEQEETAAQETTPAGQEETGASAGEKEPGEMTEEELRAEFEKQFRMQKVDDVLVQFMISLTNLAYMKMGLTEDTADVKDLAQASLAIDGYKALLEAVGKRLPDQDAQALTGALSSMQMTFVKASSPA
ncbi:MAG: DUF1844 domain-containing protein [Actinobacteria bacterium]|nr:DUF1844 domain-containing protein [Actinomycetota bacterium]